MRRGLRAIHHHHVSALAALLMTLSLLPASFAALPLRNEGPGVLLFAFFQFLQSGGGGPFAAFPPTTLFRVRFDQKCRPELGILLPRHFVGWGLEVGGRAAHFW